jgi:opacity protein-like surface antigen
MKKIFLMGSLLSAVSLSATAGQFDTWYAGAKLDYARTQIEYDDQNTGTLGNFPATTANLNGFDLDALVGRGFQIDENWVYGFEGQLGYGFAEDKKSWGTVGNAYTAQVKMRRLWKMGGSGRFGRVFSNVMVYGRFGLHATQYESRLSVSSTGGAEAGRQSSRFFSWAVAPGAGVEWNVSQGINARFEYVYEYGLNRSDVTVAGKKFQINEPKTHVFSAGLTFAI